MFGLRLNCKSVSNPIQIPGLQHFGSRPIYDSIQKPDPRSMEPENTQKSKPCSNYSYTPSPPHTDSSPSSVTEP
ncbi:hypothetical protein R6Q59_011730 [Mikania micrantha]